MTLEELRTALRIRLDDLAEPYLWSDDELNIYLNQALNEACLRADLIIDSTTPEVAVFNTVAGVNTFQLHPSVYLIEDAFITTPYTRLMKVGSKDLRVLFSDWATATGTPSVYVTDLDAYNQIGNAHAFTVYPIPDAAYELVLTVHRYPLQTLTDFDTPEIPSRWHLDLLHWAAHLAYLKTDIDTGSYERSTLCAQMFERAFGPAKSAEWSEEKRKKFVRRVTSQWL